MKNILVCAPLEKFCSPFLSLHLSLSLILTDILVQREQQEAPWEYVFVWLLPEPSNMSANRNRLQPVSFNVLTSFFHSTSRTIESSKPETSNFLDTLVFDALCSRLVAHNARLFRHFFHSWFSEGILFVYTFLADRSREVWKKSDYGA